MPDLDQLAQRIEALGLKAKQRDAKGFSVLVPSGEDHEGGASLVMTEGCLPNFSGPVGPLAWKVLAEIQDWERGEALHPMMISEREAEMIATEVRMPMTFFSRVLQVREDIARERMKGE